MCLYLKLELFTEYFYFYYYRPCMAVTPSWIVSSHTQILIWCPSFHLSSLSWFWCEQSPPIGSRYHYWFKKGLHRSYLLQATHLSHQLAQFYWNCHFFPKVQWSFIYYHSLLLFLWLPSLRWTDFEELEGWIPLEKNH